MELAGCATIFLQWPRTDKMTEIIFFFLHFTMYIFEYDKTMAIRYVFNISIQGNVLENVIFYSKHYTNIRFSPL